MTTTTSGDTVWHLLDGLLLSFETYGLGTRLEKTLSGLDGNEHTELIDV